MLTTFAHVGYVHDKSSMDMMMTIDHCMPIIVGAGITIAVLVSIVIYLLTQWQPKSKSARNRKKS